MEKTTLTKFRFTEAFLRDRNYTSHFSQEIAWCLTNGFILAAKKRASIYTGVVY